LLLKMKIVLLPLLTLLSFSANISAQRLTGSVKSDSGRPLAEVFVFPNRSPGDIAETDERGTFSVPRFETVIAFRRDGFRPLTKIVDSTITQLDVVLEDAAATQWLLARCAANDKRDRVGFTLKMRVPKEAIARKGRDADYEDLAIGYGPKSNRVWLTGITGPHSGAFGFPPYAWILNATEFSERSYKAGHIEGADLRGRLRDGTYWRYIGRLTESIKYSGLSRQQAAFFDRIIDTACVN
jgi:hypothetical protein